MKKISFLILMLSAAVSLQAAKVGFLLANAAKTFSAITNVYDEALPWDAFWDGVENHEQSPERKAYEWFNGTYSATKSYYTILDVENGALLDDGQPIVDVLWINIDRKGNFDDIFTNLITRSGFKTALANYIKAGGNVLLTKQAVRLVFETGRISGEGALPSCNTADYAASSVENYGVQEMNGASTFKIFDDFTFETYKTPLSTTSYTANRQCVWNLNGEGKVAAFESSHGCKTLGMDGTHFEEETGLVEFYPRGDYKGTILAMGLNSYEWGNDNTLKANVQKFTGNTLDYLSVKPTDVSVNWQGWETAADGYIGASLPDATVPTAGDHIASISAPVYSSSAANIASVNTSTGAVNYNYFGSATITSTVTVAGDGQWVPKNVAEVSKNKTVTISGGSASAAIGYVLTANQHLNLANEYEDILNPDKTAAQWFYTNYVEGGNGQFVNPANAIPAAVQTLWIHSDRKDLESEDYMTELGGSAFVAKLRTYLAAGKNLFVSKQATRLIGDLQRLGKLNEYDVVYPTYGASSSGDDSWEYSTYGPSRIGNSFTAPLSEEHSTHAIYKSLDVNPTLITSGIHTNRNYVIKLNDSWAGLTTHEDFDSYQTTHECRLLGDWGTDASKYECGGLVEFYPKDDVGEGGNAFDQKGTIIMLGLGAYQWVNPTINTQTLSANILSYLATTSAPAIAWEAEPIDGEVAESQNISVSFADGAVTWEQTAGEGSVMIDEHPDHPYDSEYRVLYLTGIGSVTITASRNGDGYALPRNVTPTSLSKSINVATNIYTRDVSAYPDYYGTICLPRAAESYEGATMFRLVDKTADDGVVIEEVNNMEAGIPYFFYPKADEVRVTMTGNKVAAGSRNGLVGYIGDGALPLAANDNYYILSYNKIWKLDVDVNIPSNRAYIDMSAIASLPHKVGMRRVAINGRGSTTDIEQMENEPCEIRKFIRDGRLVIIRDNRIFNALGQCIQ